MVFVECFGVLVEVATECCISSNGVDELSKVVSVDPSQNHQGRDEQYQYMASSHDAAD